MLGSVAEAEDVVQEALLRVHQALHSGEQIASPRAFVATVTTRLAINELRSARARRERYVGEWLPEPIITDGKDDPAGRAEMADSLSVAMLVLLESLSPEQRAVMLLHDVFDYGYPEIAAMVGKSEGNVRLLATRARRHVEQRRLGSKLRASSAKSCQPASLRPPNGAISSDSRRCSLTKWS
jgi:RNA polymerase sigma factor (sigma-70 family)